MAITDLTGTTWVFNDYLDDTSLIRTYVDFTSNGITFASIERNYSTSPFTTNILIYYNSNGISTNVCDLDSWTNEAYKTITITGGADATNATLISWLQANATLQETPTTDTKPIFKRINGTWVKQDAFQRVSGAWVRISSKEAGNLLTTSNDKILQDSNGNNLEFTPQLATPQNVSVSGTTISWGAVENATSYEILVGGSSFGTVSTTSIDLSTLSGWEALSSGSHSITIVAKADRYKDSEPSAAVNVEKAAAFKQIFPTKTPDNYTLIENLNKNKIYSIYTWYNVVIIKFTNKWESNFAIFIDSQTENSIKFHVRNDGTYFEQYLDGITLEGDREAISADFRGFSSTTVYAKWHCFVEGTKITLSDGSTKPVQYIQYIDELLAWDFDNACLTSAKPLWIMKEHKATKYNHLVFSDGSTLDTVNQHRIFNLEKGMFTYPMTDDTPIGTTTVNDKGEYITLVSKEVIEKEVSYYNIITDYHINLFAGSILTSCRLSNLYPIKDMKYVKDDRNIIPYEEFNNIPIEYYYGLRLGEQPTDINRDGAVSFGDTSVEDYVKRLINMKKE